MQDEPGLWAAGRGTVCVADTALTARALLGGAPPHPADEPVHHFVGGGLCRISTCESTCLLADMIGLSFFYCSFLFGCRWCAALLSPPRPLFPPAMEEVNYTLLILLYYVSSEWW